MNFGEYLRKERELRGLTLEEMSQHTKIHARFLDAIEHDDFSILPAKAFAKGFLRSYARMVDLDEDQVMVNFEYFHRTLRPETDAQTQPPTSSDGVRHPWLWFIVVCVVLGLTAMLILYYQGYFRWQ